MDNIKIPEYNQIKETDDNLVDKAKQEAIKKQIEKENVVLAQQAEQVG